MFTLIIEFHIN